MKSLLGILTILISVSAQAAPSAQQVANVVQQLNGTYCMDAIESGVYLATAASDEVKANILDNLSLYNALLTQAKSNVKNKRSNDAIYRQFKLIMDSHRNETYTGFFSAYQTVETGKAVVGCIERNVKLSPSLFNSVKNIETAQAFINNIKAKAE